MFAELASRHGWVIVDKPAGLTSAAVVGRVKRLTGARKAGHGGTLDPLATGVLPVALGEATKTVPFIFEGRKTYRFAVRWGESRSTDDAEGEVTGASAVRPAREAIVAALGRFTGRIAQVPPVYSAVKHGGQRAYALARAGRPPPLAPRLVDVHRFELVAQPDRDAASFVVECGKGTYVRALARDLAAALGTVAYVTELRRTRSGPFHEDQAISLDKLAALGHSARPETYLLPVEAALAGIPALALTDSQAERLRHGVAVPVSSRHDGTVCVTAAGRLVALAEVAGCELRPVRVFDLEG